MTWIWRSRWVGSVSAEALRTAVERGGTTTAASARVLGHTIVNPILVVGAVGDDGGERLVDLVEQGAEFGGIVDFLAGQGRGDDRAGLGIDSPGAACARPGGAGCHASRPAIRPAR